MPTSRSKTIALRCSIAMIGALAACGGASGDQSCQHDSDCPSNFCKADGTCAAVTNDGGGSGRGDAPAGSNADGSTGACTPNHDGTITAAEVPLVPGTMANFDVTTSTSAAVSSAGATGSDGQHTWDLSGQLTGDGTVAVTLLSPTGAYWASKFPTATYATQLSASADLLGVFAASATGVDLLGVVSPSSGSGTDLAYSPSAIILQLPFKAGDTWTSTSTVTGTADDIFTTYTEEYASTADDVGTMKTPYGAFPVIRVNTLLTRDDIPVTRTFAWVSECFGTVATMTSQTGSTSGEITSASEVRRLAP